MKVLRVRPKHLPEVIDIDCSLESLQKGRPDSGCLPVGR